MEESGVTATVPVKIRYGSLTFDIPTSTGNATIADINEILESLTGTYGIPADYEVTGVNLYPSPKSVNVVLSWRAV